MRCFSFLAFLLVLHFAATSPPDRQLFRPPVDGKVFVEIYCGSLNEQCKKFFAGSFKQALKVKVKAFGIQGVLDLADIRIIPFGNGNIDKYGRDYDFTCQNGPEECIGNVLYQCALTNYYEAISFAFIACLAENQGNWLEVYIPNLNQWKQVCCSEQSVLGSIEGLFE
jgi:hypothetical protein